MEVSRRSVLALALSGAAAGVVRTAPAASARPSATARTFAAGSRFPGDPGAGRLYYGVSMPDGLRAWEAELGRRVSLHRKYYQANQAEKIWRQARRDHERGRVPHLSTKPPGSWASVAAGTHDDWIRYVAATLGRLDSPVFFTVHHEPEDDAGGAGMQPRNFVEMTTRVVNVFARHAPNVAVFPVLQSWSFDYRSGRNPAEWFVAAAPIFGVDLYNPWSATNGKSWVSFSEKMQEIKPYAQGRPIAVGEHGCRTDRAHPGRAADWMRNAFTYAQNNNIISMSYFNSDRNSPDGTWELDYERGPVFAANLASQNAARI